MIAAVSAALRALVKIEHTVFALPFAYVGALLAVDGVPSAHDLLWITVAMVGARSLAMGLNRLIDAGIDARNPRTATRELPARRLTRARRSRLLRRSRSPCSCSPCGSSTRSCAGCGRSRSLGFVIYPYLKRFTWLSHLWLGAVDGLAPVGAWVAITGELPWRRGLLGAAVACWVAGFDLFYSLLDVEVDRREGLHSWATRFGEQGVFAGARVLHAADRRLLLAAAGARARRRLVVLARRRRRARRCSSTSTRSSARATCAGSTRRSSR